LDSYTVCNSSYNNTHPLALLSIQAAVPSDNDDLGSPLSPSPSFPMENMQHGWSERQGAAYLSATAREFKYINSPQRYGPSERGRRGVLSRESDREIEKVRKKKKRKKKNKKQMNNYNNNNKTRGRGGRKRR
jgi:hypothetical protein